MLDRSKCKKMFVWDDDKRPEGPYEMIVVEGCEDGSCFAVDEDDEERFLNGGGFTVCHWYHYEEIPEKKMRPMTHLEIFAMMQHQMRRGNLVLFQHTGGAVCSSWYTYNTIQEHTYSLDLGKTWHKLEVEE